MENKAQFKKYTSGYYCLQHPDTGLQHGDQVTVTTRYGKEVECTIWKKLGNSKAGEGAYYSHVRNDGFNRKEWMKRKAERATNAAERQNNLSDEYFAKSQKDRDFLTLGEPIKVGHHSEKRHRKIINQAQENTGKMVAASKKAERYTDKAEELESRINCEINIDTPESLELLKQRVADLTEKRDALKASKKYETWQLSNLGANIRRYKERLETAKKLWDMEADADTPTKKEKNQEAKISKQQKVNELLKRHGCIFAFNNKQFEEQRVPDTVYINCGSGLLVPSNNYDAFAAEYKAL